MKIDDIAIDEENSVVAFNTGNGRAVRTMIDPTIAKILGALISEAINQRGGLRIASIPASVPSKPQKPKEVHHETSNARERKAHVQKG